MLKKPLLGNTGGAAGASATFNMTVNIPSDNYTYELYMSGNNPRGVMTVDWGDGNNSTITTYNDGNNTNTYATAGTYQIKMGGYIHGINHINASQAERDLVVSVDSWGTDTDFWKLQQGFYYCRNMISLPSDGTYVQSVSGDQLMAWETFYRCTSLTAFPEVGIFTGCNFSTNVQFWQTFEFCQNITGVVPATVFDIVDKTDILNFYGAFSNCESITGVHEDIFAGATGLQSNVFSLTFSNTFSLTTVPENLFANVDTIYGTWLNGGSYVFQNSGITSIPANLFKNMSKPFIEFQYWFYGCASLTSIPADLFRAGLFNASGDTYQATFGFCYGLTSLPATLFEQINSGSQDHFRNTFQSCTSLTTVPETLFSGITHNTEWNSTFRGCTSLTTVPANLFPAQSTIDVSFREVFWDCHALDNIPSTLLDANRAKTDDVYGMFRGCRSLSSIPSGFFANMPNQVGWNYLFYDCEALTTVPSDLFANTLYSTAWNFSYMFAESGITTLPVGIFSHVPADTECSFGTMFYNCDSLTTLPEGVFNNFIPTSCYRMFALSTNLTSMPRIFKANFSVASGSFQECFSNCTSLTSVADGFFSGKTITDDGYRQFYQCFYYCTSLTTVPNGISDGGATWTDDEVYKQCFQNSAITSIPANFYQGSTNITEINADFKDTDITSVPAGLFDNLTSVARVFTVFENCYSLTTIPANLFQDMTSLWYISSCFRNTAIVNVPDIFGTAGAFITDFYRVFDNVQPLLTVDSKLFQNLTSCVTWTQVFNGCYNLTVPSTLFYEQVDRDTRFLNQSPNFYRMFWSAVTFTGTQGTAPDLWNADYGTGAPTNTNECFGIVSYKLDRFSNGADIPSDWD